MFEEFGESCLVGGWGGRGESGVGRGRGKESLEFGEDEACVEVDVSTYREEWDSAVCGAEGGNVWAGHGCRLHL